MQAGMSIVSILQVLPGLESGGVERGTIEMVDAINKAGMKPYVASCGGSLVPMVGRHGGTHITLPLYSKNPFIIWRNAKKLAGLIKQHNISLVHARSRAPAWSAYLACKWTNRPFVTTFHGVYNLQGFMKQRYNSVMARGKRVIAVSQFVREHILENYNVTPEQVIRIDRGVDFKLFTHDRIVPDRMAQLTKEWRIPDDAKNIILVPGRITRIKGQMLVLRALTRLKETDFICVFLGNAAGHEQYVKELQQFITENELEGKIRMVPHTPYMAEAYALSDVVLMPSLKPESFGRVAVEAQAMGKLVIASDHGGARETIVPNETGYLVRNNDPTMLAEALDYALTRDEDTKTAMAEFAVRHVRAHYSIARMKNATIRLYKEVLGQAVAEDVEPEESMAPAPQVAVAEQAYG